MSSCFAKIDQVPRTAVAIYPDGLLPLPITSFMIRDLSSALGMDRDAECIQF